MPASLMMRKTRETLVSKTSEADGQERRYSLLDLQDLGSLELLPLAELLLELINGLQLWKGRNTRDGSALEKVKSSHEHVTGQKTYLLQQVPDLLGDRVDRLDDRRLGLGNNRRGDRDRLLSLLLASLGSPAVLLALALDVPAIVFPRRTARRSSRLALARSSVLAVCVRGRTVG